MLVSASMLADGERSYAIPPVRLHPLTGESGSPIVGAHRGNSPLWARLDERLDVMIRKPLADAWKWAALPVRGWVGANCRLAARGPVIEWLRLTPEPLEATTLLPQWGGDAVPALMAAASGNLTDQDTPVWQTEPGVSVLLIAAGWPASYPTGQPVAGLADLEPGILVFQGNTANPLGFTYTPKAERYASRGGSVWSVLTDRLSGSHSAAASGTTVSGGEILAVVAHAPELATARRRAYANLEHIHVAGTTFLRGVGEHEL
jgi:phosphoribosylamine--glycine ligase